MIELHKIQKETVTLLNELYQADRLAVTPAMLSIQNGYYPDIESILNSLKHYKEIDRVKVFLLENKNIIEETEEYLEAKKVEESEAKSTQNDSELFGDIFGDIFNNKPPTTELFENVKSVNVEELESSLTDMISEKLNDKIKVSVNNVSNKHSGNVEINLIISK